MPRLWAAVRVLAGQGRGASLPSLREGAGVSLTPEQQDTREFIDYMVKREGTLEVDAAEVLSLVVALEQRAERAEADAERLAEALRQMLEGGCPDIAEPSADAALRAHEERKA